ncbi:MAG: FAD-binding oxidoreductase [Alphaproteobacteria bacterium]|nr:FAD-binding oxidoreductase [Alphaproteobacteria bacterium]
MMQQRYDIVIVGAGMAGIAAAYALNRGGAGTIAIIDRGPPLALTSDKSTECYRNFWPGPDDAMLSLMNDSIACLAHHASRSGDRFQLRQRGYLFATARPEEIDALAAQATEVERFGGGPLRHHGVRSRGGGYPVPSYPVSPAAGFDPTLDGADLIADRSMIRDLFPYLAQDTSGVLHVRKCGALSAQQLGMYLLEEAREAGVALISADVIGIETKAGRVSGVRAVTQAGETTIEAGAVVCAAGPYLKSLTTMAGANLPLKVEAHTKISLADHLAVLPRTAPLIIWNDPIEIPWSQDERSMLAELPETARLLRTMPAGVHGRPVGAGNQALMYWTYDCEISDEPRFPMQPSEFLPDVTLRGMAVMVPGLSAYLDPMPKPYVDGGYYTKTPDNRPLIGPLAMPGAYVCGAFSGYGIMAACASGELLAAHVLATPLPNYASAFRPDRFADPAYLDRIEGLTLSGQL